LYRPVAAIALHPAAAVLRLREPPRALRADPHGDTRAAAGTADARILLYRRVFERI